MKSSGLSLLWLITALFAGLHFFNSVAADDHSTGNPAATTAVAQRADAIVAAFSTFLTENKIEQGAIAVSYQGKLIASHGKQRKPSDPAKLASLSKAITALCAVKALQESDASPDVTLGEILADSLARHPSRDPDFDRISVSQLITHTSGLQIPHVSKLGTTIVNFERERKSWQLDQIVRFGLSAKPGDPFHYTNANYLLLGLVIERLTSTPYEAYCTRALLTPIGITTAGLSKQWRFLSAYGGWEMSAEDYLTFVQSYFKTHQVMGYSPVQISSSVSDTLKYGLGTLMRQTNRGYIYWHTGSFIWRSRTISDRFAAYFAIYDNGYAVSVNYSVDSGEGRGESLDSALYSAANS